MPQAPWHPEEYRFKRTDVILDLGDGEEGEDKPGPAEVQKSRAEIRA